MTQTASISGFGPGAMVMTTQGELPVEWLESGDKVITRDHGAQAIVHIARSRGALPGGAALPVPLRLDRYDAAGQDSLIEPLRLSPHTRVLLRGAQVALHFGDDEVMAQIGDLSRRQHFRDEPDCPRLTYHHLILPRHALIWSCGIWVETAGAETVAQLDLPQRVADLAQGYWSPRSCLTAPEAQMMRSLLAPEQSVMSLIAA